MLELTLLAAGYLACCAAAFWLLVEAWRWSHDVRRIDAWFFGLISLLGPVALCSALAIAGIEWQSRPGHRRRRSEEIVWRKR